MPSWYVYIVKCADDSLYTGVTTDIVRRLQEHNQSRRAAAYTRTRRPVALVYTEALADRSAACRREAEIKSLDRQAKHTLIATADTPYIRPINAAQKTAVEALTRDYIDQAGRLFGQAFQPIAVVFDLSGRAAGMYKIKRGQRMIRYNPWLFAKYYAESLTNTVPHEVAHYIVDCLYDRRHTRPHGPAWQDVMQRFGAECRVTGEYDLTGIPVRKQRTFTYRCGCRQYEISCVRHKRIQRGVAYCCRHCHAPIAAIA